MKITVRDKKLFRRARILAIARKEVTRKRELLRFMLTALLLMSVSATLLALKLGGLVSGPIEALGAALIGGLILLVGYLYFQTNPQEARASKALAKASERVAEEISDTWGALSLKQPLSEVIFALAATPEMETKSSACDFYRKQCTLTLVPELQEVVLRKHRS